MALVGGRKLVASTAPAIALPKRKLHQMPNKTDEQQELRVAHFEGIIWTLSNLEDKNCQGNIPDKEY